MTEETKKAEEAKVDAVVAEAKEEKKEEKPLSAEVKKVLESVSKLNAADKAQLGLEIIKSLTVMELADWVKTLETEFGVSAAPVAVAGAAVPGATAGAAPAEEQTEFNVILTSAGDKKIQVIKEVRTVTDLGLKEAKALVDGAPKAIKEGVSKKEADEIKAKMEAQGATIEIK